MPSTEMTSYREYMKKMLEMEKQKLAERYEKAWGVAKQIAYLLRQKYGANKVWVFGSLTNKEMFNQWSDIDIAVEGIPSEYYYKAVAEVISFSQEYKIDIVDVFECSPLMQENIQREGILI
ncbi:MAG TPA: nucleotidyltransferase domain-containing protein [Thermoanaerobacterales bacterium]|nr:nucleotidyltransferase domain-containing protein [Thermoanaerobacterales bacterium]